MRSPATGRRPPWWPEGEPWPPEGPPGHALRGRFLHRIGCLFGCLALASLGGFALIVLMFSAWSPPEAWHGRGPWGPPIGGLVFLLILGTLGIVGRALRRQAMPVGDLLEASERIAEGDYSVRVSDTGPPEVSALARAFNSMTTRLQEHDDQRRSLLADVTHELRTPLTVIQGNLEALVDGVYRADEEHLKAILDETHVLARRIDELRTLALSESGALRLRKEPTDLGMLAREALGAFEAQAEEAQVALELETAPDLPLVEVDPARIRQVLDNLLSNALRYTPEGGTVRIRQLVNVEGSRSPQSIVLTVEDSGPGIPRKDLPHVFDRFHRATDSGGMGLGLAIAKSLVVAHGGDITAESEPSHGTTMRITLPLPPARG